MIDALAFQGGAGMRPKSSVSSWGSSGSCKPQPFLCFVEVSNAKSAWCLEIKVKSCQSLKNGIFHIKFGSPAFLEKLEELACWDLFSGRPARGWSGQGRTLGTSAVLYHSPQVNE